MLFFKEFKKISQFYPQVPNSLSGALLYGHIQSLNSCDSMQVLVFILATSACSTKKVQLHIIYDTDTKLKHTDTNRNITNISTRISFLSQLFTLYVINLYSMNDYDYTGASHEFLLTVFLLL